MSHYFTEPGGIAKYRTITASVWSQELEFTVANGVFASEGLDKGTAVLLRECRPAANARRLLDLGCGWGALSVALARALPAARIDAIDVNPRAIELTRMNAQAHGVAHQIRACAPEEVASDTYYDEIWSNPPIRIGKAALHELLSTWLARLAPNGVARMVVSKNLGADSLQTWLSGSGWECERTSSAKGFRILRVNRGE